mmetsp:Transcript_19412/g.40957  ORF Transcript_19412/g.40957 Transcript_19412/m.40957 type:complete len:131 (+) Transcript_19412:1629-2021(+)
MAEDQNLAARWRRSTFVRGGGNSMLVADEEEDDSSLSAVVIVSDGGAAVVALAMNIDCLLLKLLVVVVVVTILFDDDENAFVGCRLGMEASATNASDESFMVNFKGINLEEMLFASGDLVERNDFMNKCV